MSLERAVNDLESAKVLTVESTEEQLMKVSDEEVEEAQ
jgi:hypothetical protein